MTLNTSLVTYDFVRARKEGDRIDGFTTTRLRNQIGSDFLRGLQLSVEHDLFGTEDRNGEDKRVFDPILSQLNLSFALSSSSGIIQTLGRLLGGGEDEESEAESPTAADSVAGFVDPDGLDPNLDDVGNVSPTAESSIVPGAGSDDVAGSAARRAARRGATGAWNANFSYSLNRNRDSNLPASQLLQMGIRLRPAEKWDLVWRTSYDIEAGKFADHTIRLTRDLHRWQANFDYSQTAAGNWSFRFQVSLRDNPDLKFDYDQNNTDLANPF